MRRPRPANFLGLGSLWRKAFERPGLKTVTVIVPNYNYAHYLDQRLASIFAQTYPIYEILVLDDASGDDSLATLAAIRASTGREFEILINDSNSGSVFKQWAKGVARARGELIWIAEADDLAEPGFLEAMVRAFADPAVNMAFANSRQIDENSAPLADSYDFYYAKHAPDLMTDLKLPGLAFLERVIGVRNVVFNVSSVLFRRSALAAALEASAAEIDLLRVAGDWNVYLEICRQPGGVAYVSKALNIHRRHQGSVTLSLDYWRHIAEIFAIHRKVQAVVGSSALAAEQTAYIDELVQQLGLKPLSGYSIERTAALKWLDDLAADPRLLRAALATLPTGLRTDILCDVPPEFATLRGMPRHAAD